MRDIYYSNRWRIALGVLLSVAAAGCRSAADNEVVVYTALDEDFSKPIFAEFAAETGSRVVPKFDTEATKTVGLTEAILAQRRRPRCDVFWNNEILNTLRLERAGLLAEYRSPAAKAYPEWAKSQAGTWHGFAARARILIVNTKIVATDQRPKSIRDLADPKWRGKTGIAKPLFGTTATHAACLFAALGKDEAQTLFRAMKQNEVRIEAGNKQVAVSVAAGRLAFGLTDTDDALVQIAGGDPVAIVYPDQGEGQLGTLFIPNTLAIIKGGPNPAAARRLVDYLLSAEVERRLAAGPSGQIPLNPEVDIETKVKTPRDVKAMEVDWQAAVDRWAAAAQFIRGEFAVADE
jgi:iron(III) transport system substrate-binding protein